MADQNARGFRRFMLDPKNSVMTYIADNIPPEHLSHQQGSNGRLQNGPMNSQQSNTPDPNRLQQNQVLGQNAQNQSQDDFIRPPLPTRPSQSNSQSSSPRPGYAQPVHSSQMPMNTPYIASNVSQANQGPNGYAGTQSQLPGSHSMSNIAMAPGTMSQQGPQSQYSSLQSSSPSTAKLGQGPPQPGSRRRNSPQSAPRLYHRLILEFEITKKAFFVAKSRKMASPHKSLGAPTDIMLENDIQEMTSAAYELESIARRIWGLRFEHSWEFEGYSEAGHQAVYSKWQAEYEMWADTVLDIQDGQVLADAANPSKYGNTSMHRDAEERDSQSRQDRSGFQGLNGETQHQNSSMQQGDMPPHMLQQMPQHQPVLSHQQMALQQEMPPPQQMPPQQQFPPSQQMPPQQQMPQLPDLPMAQSMPPGQSMQNSRPPQPMLPGSFAQNGPPPTMTEQNMPPQQRQQSPQPPQMTNIQNPPPTMQNGPSMQPSPFNGPPNTQNIANTPAQTMQQPQRMSSPNFQQPQNTRPGQAPGMQQGQNRPPQQYMQQQQQQNIGPGQQGPPRNGMPPGQPMSQGQNLGPRQNASPRPDSQVPLNLQAGGQMRGNGRQ
ncbi:hypothetical protein IMSHALPRED_004607 [Imshaugia aleurites]|uniref:Uncharacterized protein n=1 Tax=Imshaugia aleurites TaxID=172621 RepID=A0A8H3J8T9_9LECA|nr:hypothetical protein IMSHALPRED_004607 [Imshaugia aleurites]